MTWTLKTSPVFDKQFKKLQKRDKRRIISYLEDRVLPSNNPKQFAKYLTGELAGLWRFRIGEYRVIVDIIDEVCVVIALEVDHRKSIYT